MKINANNMKNACFAVFYIFSLVIFFQPTQTFAEADPHAHHKAMLKKADSFKRSTHSYNLPNLTLLDKEGTKTTVKEIFDKNKTIMVNFIFTSCNTICPIMSGTFARVDKELSKLDENVQLISITIDPEFDTPRVLKEYAKMFEGSDQWKFYTGTRDDIIKLQTAFNAYRGSKMNHVPITLIRNAKNEEWVRIDGFASTKALIRQVQSDKPKQELAKNHLQHQ